MRNSTVTRIAIIGAGFMGTMHGESCLRIPDVSVPVIADEDLSRAQPLAEKLGADAVASAEDAIANYDVDAVIAAVPTPLHRQIVELAARHGKHVFCEKPIASTAADGEAMVSACRDAGVRLMVGHVVRFFPDYAKIHDILRQGALGTIGVVRASRLNAHPGKLRPWYASAAQSGGVVLDMMIHDLDTLRWYFGEADRIYARSLLDSPYASRADYALAVIRFANGVIAHVEASWAHSGFRTSIEIAGEHGVVRSDSQESAALKIERTGNDQGNASIVSFGPQAASPYEIELRHFLSCLASGEPFLTPGEEGLRSLELALAVIESAKSGKMIAWTGGTRQSAERVSA